MSESNTPDVKPNKLPHMTTEQVKERAKIMLNAYGVPPYAPERLFTMSDDPAIRAAQEAAAAHVSEFVFYWMPFMVVKK